MIQFCPVCKKILLLKEENGKNIGVCSCGFKRMSGYDLSSSEKGEDKLALVGEGIIEKEDFGSVEKLTYEDKKERKADF
jgi:DNA-directed RNA polymerase subunit M/transcription elongation factor TFIIS